MKKCVLTILLLCCCAVALTACDREDEPDLKYIASKYDYRTLSTRVTDRNGEQADYTLEYRLLEPGVLQGPSGPVSHMPEGGYPLVIFLAGKDEAFHMDQLLIHGADYFLKWERDYPCYVAFPRCDEGCYWSYPQRPWPFLPSQLKWPESPSKMYDALLALVNELSATYPVNPKRIVITGFSMGAFGALDMAARAPYVFAGVAANAGGLNVKRAGALKYMHVWLEHCEGDAQVPCELSRALAEELAYIKGSDARVSLSVHIYPGGSHVSFHWFDSPELMEWIYSVRMRTQQPASGPAADV